VLVGEHAEGLVAGLDVVTEEQRFGPHGASLVDHTDLDVGAEERDRAFDRADGGIGTVDVRRCRLAACPLVRQHRREVRGVIVVQMREEHRAHRLETEVGRDKRAHRAVAAVDEIRNAVDDDGARGLTAREVHAGAAARPARPRAARGAWPCFERAEPRPSWSFDRAGGQL
jgi:hypothetical protein